MLKKVKSLERETEASGELFGTYREGGLPRVSEMINSKIRKVGERLKSNSRSWPCQVLSYLANLVPCAGLSQGEEKQILGAFEDVVFHLTIRIPSASPTALCRAFAGHVICQGRPPPQLAL